MKKDSTRDYVTAIFRSYAAAGCPTYAAERERIYTAAIKRYIKSGPAEAVTRAEKAVADAGPYLSDIFAAERTMALLEANGKCCIADAVRAVYFVSPKSPIGRGVVSERVRRYARTCPADESTVYRWLREARHLCAVCRGLYVPGDESEKRRSGE